MAAISSASSLADLVVGFVAGEAPRVATLSPFAGETAAAESFGTGGFTALRGSEGSARASASWTLFKLAATLDAAGVDASAGAAATAAGAATVSIDAAPSDTNAAEATCATGTAGATGSAVFTTGAGSWVCATA